jgi:hypothetical protein
MEAEDDRDTAWTLGLKIKDYHAPFYFSELKHFTSAPWLWV